MHSEFRSICQHLGIRLYYYAYYSRGVKGPETEIIGGRGQFPPAKYWGTMSPRPLPIDAYDCHISLQASVVHQPTHSVTAVTPCACEQ